MSSIGEEMNDAFMVTWSLKRRPHADFFHSNARDFLYKQPRPLLHEIFKLHASTCTVSGWNKYKYHVVFCELRIGYSNKHGNYDDEENSENTISLFFYDDWTALEKKKISSNKERADLD